MPNPETQPETVLRIVRIVDSLAGSQGRVFLTQLLILGKAAIYIGDSKVAIIDTSTLRLNIQTGLYTQEINNKQLHEFKREDLLVFRAE